MEDFIREEESASAIKKRKVGDGSKHTVAGPEETVRPVSLTTFSGKIQKGSSYTKTRQVRGG